MVSQATSYAQDLLRVECPLSDERKFYLMQKSSYWVDDIHCVNNRYYKWVISNKRAAHKKRTKSQRVLGRTKNTHKFKSSLRKKKIASPLQKRRLAPRSVTSDVSQQRKIASTSPKKTPTHKRLQLSADDTGVFDFNLGLGANYYSHNQKGALGGANVGALFLNNLSISTSYERKNFKMETQAQSYKFKYDAGGTQTERRLYSYGFNIFYKNFFLGLNIEQQPLFKNNGSNIEMTTETAVLPSLGLKWDIPLSTTIETHLHIQTSLNYFMDSQASDPNIKVSDHSGFGANIKTRLSRKLNKSKRYPMYYYWSNDFSHRDYERAVQWGGSNGTVDSQHFHFNSSVGIKIEF